MAHILILTLGSRGDVQPYTALAGALTQRGHKVTLSTGLGFDDLIPNDVEYKPLSIDMEALLQDPEMQAALHGIRTKIRAFRSTRDMMLKQLDEMWEISQQLEQDVIIYHPKAFIAPYFAQALGVIAIPSFLQPAFRPTREFLNPLLSVREVGPLTNRMLGAAMIRLMRFGYNTLLKGWFARHPEFPHPEPLDVLAGYHPRRRPVPRLNAHSSCLVPKPADWGLEEHVTGDWYDAETTDWLPPEDLNAFLNAGPPPTYIGFGSMPASDSDRMTGLFLDALNKTGQRAILSAGWGGLESRPNTDAIYHLTSAPHDWLFPRCRAVVHHGGAGTTHAGLRHGRATLICPHFGDQTFWGRRVAALGAGQNPIPVRSLNVSNLVEALTGLENDRCEKAAADIARCMSSERGTVTAAGLIEQTLDA
ncbi:MAG: glycosyltransferase [Pseudomonadota bacterium]